jgi:DNA-directed RNA polymerase specialized sigma24 family protein
MTEKYKAGATVYELAAEFGCHRATVAERLKKAEITMRGQFPAPEAIDPMVGLYTSGFSLLEVGKQLGFSADAVRNYLLLSFRKWHRYARYPRTTETMKAPPP